MNRLLAPRSLSHLPTTSTIRPEISRCRLIHCAPGFQAQSQQPHLIQSHTPKFQFPIQKRTFLSSFIPTPRQSSTNGNGNNKARVLTAFRTLPYPPSPLFNVISSVESYAEFLPFLTVSTVTARDPETRYPTQAYLTVGYGPLSETFTSKVDCDRDKWVVEARSGERFVQEQRDSNNRASSGLGALAGFAGFPGADEGIFEYLSTRWELVPEPASEGKEAKTTVKLEIRFEFKSQMYASMMSAVEGQMAGIMIEAFEKRIREVHGR
ncbi:dehydrase and lipid transport-domain-containing protein [Aspergillus recurvatus]